jgi:biopolymer transport protein TolR
MLRSGKRRKPIAEINVVPYIDVTLVLLIIFMITTPLLQTGVEVELPQATSKTIESDNKPPVIVSVNQQGQYFINIDASEDEPVSDQELLVRIEHVLKQQPKSKILVRGDRSVNYGAVLTILAALQEAGVADVGLMTRPNEPTENSQD